MIEARKLAKNQIFTYGDVLYRFIGLTGESGDWVQIQRIGYRMVGGWVLRPSLSINNELYQNFLAGNMVNPMEIEGTR